MGLITNKCNSLKKELFTLQQNGTVTWANYRKSNFDFYKHFSELYFWWRKASKVKGYLDIEYAGLDKKFKSFVKYGTNFSPLLYLVWGQDNCSNSDADRHSRALNKIHAEYLRRASYFSKDGVHRMAKYIEEENGIAGLCGYGKLDDEEDAVESTSSNKDILNEEEKQALVYDKAKNFYKHQQGAPSIDFGSELATNTDEFSLILVKKSPAGYALLGSTNDENLIQATTIANFKHNLNAIPTAVKCVVETLRTQVLPPSIFSFHSALVDKASSKTLATRRLIYRHTTNDFLLSPVRTACGVVTLVKPKQVQFTDLHNDVLLSTRARKTIESKLIVSQNFNLYELDDDVESSPADSNNGLAKLLRLKDMFNYRNFVFLDFWHFESNSLLPLVQACIKSDALYKCSWTHALDISFFRHMTLDVLDKWFMSHAKYIKRDKGKLCQLTFEQDKFTIEFVHVDGLFEVKRELQFKVPNASIAKITLLFLTKDIMPVLRSIAEFDAVGDILVQVNNLTLNLSFSTSTADISIFVPTADAFGMRNTTAFEPYTAIVKEKQAEFDLEIDTTEADMTEEFGI